MTRIFVSVLDSQGSHVPNGVVIVYDRNAQTYPQRPRRLEHDAPTAVALAPEHLNTLLMIAVKVPAFPQAEGEVLNLSHEIDREVAGPLHVIFRLPACSGPHMFDGPGRPPETFEDASPQISPAQPGPAPGIEVEQAEIPCRQVLFEVQDDGQSSAGADYLFQLWQHDVNPLTNPIRVSPGQSVMVEVPRGSTTCNARVWRNDALGHVIPGSENRYFMWDRKTEGSSLMIVPAARLPMKAFHTERIDPPNYTIPYRWPKTDHHDQQADSRVPHVYKNHQNDRQLSALARTYWEECHAHAKREVLKRQPHATNFRVKALLSGQNTEFVLREVSGSYTWHAFYADGSALPSQRIRADLRIDGIIAEWVLDG